MNVSSLDDSAFLKRLTAIVEANLSNEQFGVNELAAKMGVSRSLIHRKLKSATNQSVSQFIREIRLKKAKDLLEKEKLTVSEIAYKVGFGSPSYFIKCFHDKFGFAPGEYLKYAPVLSEKKRNDKSRGLFYQRPSYVLLSVFITFIIITLLIVFNWGNEFSNKIAEKSIAVLPLKNTIPDSETQILADGILEDILNRLSHVHELTVKSRNSSDVYSNSTKTTSQIAAELDVSYLLEGTILKEGENIRIYIQLIDAINDKHIWSAEYGKDLSGVFEFITDVSGQITSELETVLTESEKKYIEKVYTKNTEAYKLYQKGRFFWHRRSEQGLKQSIEYFNQALELDPEYSLAWAGLADSYLILTFWGWYTWDEGFLKSREYALEAIRLDNYLAEPHVTLGSMELYYNQNWKFAEKEFLKSIEINPNYSNGYLFYADYLSMLGKYEEARIYLDKAIELYPNALINYHESSRIYLNQGKFDEALKECEKLFEIDKNFKPNYWRKFTIYYFKGEGLKAISELNQYLLLSNPSENHLEKLNQTYGESGLNGVVYWLIEYFENQKRDNTININKHFTIARLYGMLGERDSVLEQLRRGFQMGKSAEICYLFSRYEFKFLHDDPEFIDLLKMTKIPLD